ncbi:hypothetical protein ACWENQ_32215 [Nonomuraea sp. NPDC004354]
MRLTVPLSPRWSVAGPALVAGVGVSAVTLSVPGVADGWEIPLLALLGILSGIQGLQTP